MQKPVCNNLLLGGVCLGGPAEPRALEVQPGLFDCLGHHESQARTHTYTLKQPRCCIRRNEKISQARCEQGRALPSPPMESPLLPLPLSPSAEPRTRQQQRRPSSPECTYAFASHLHQSKCMRHGRRRQAGRRCRRGCRCRATQAASGEQSRGRGCTRRCRTEPPRSVSSNRVR